MEKENPIEVISRAIDEIESDLSGHPLSIKRPGKEEFVLVSAQTYSNLVARIHDLEQGAMSEAEKQREQEDLLALMKNAT